MMKYRRIAMNLTGVEICVVNNLSTQRPPEFTPMSQLPLYLRRAATGLKFALLAMILGSAITIVFAAVTGSISGTAGDTQGAVVPDTTVTLRNTQTGVVQTARTDSAGFYSFPSLPLGHYDVTFDKSGF